jgi:hypothetical protein
MEHVGRHLVGRAVCRIDHQLQAAQRQVVEPKVLLQNSM